SLRASLYEASSGDDAVTRLDRADAALRAMGVNEEDVYRLPWKHWLGEEPAIRAFTRRLTGWSIDEWDGPEWDAVAAAYRAGEAVAAAVIMRLVTTRNSVAFTNYREEVAAAHAGETSAAAARILVNASGYRSKFSGIDVFGLKWAALSASQKAVTRTLVSRWVGPGHTARWDDSDWGVVVVAGGFGDAVTAAVIKQVTSRRNYAALASYKAALMAADLTGIARDIAGAATHMMQAVHELRHSDIDFFGLEWAARSVREQAEIEALVRHAVPGRLFTRPTARWTAREWGVVAVAREYAGQDVAAAAAQRLARSPQPQEWSGQRGPAGGLRV
ncbi:hypothetical protein PV350_46580, partial [Streptomyces sp. PA03-6a]|nr:hypothetical protein [Streptomyces sp. PA03-6a]